MDSTFQILFDAIVGIAAFLAIWVMNALKDSIKVLHESDVELSKKLQNIEVLVAGNYTTRPELQIFADAVFKKLEQMHEKLDLKADKSSCGHIHDRRAG